MSSLHAQSRFSLSFSSPQPALAGDTHLINAKSWVVVALITNRAYINHCSGPRSIRSAQTSARLIRAATAARTRAGRAAVTPVRSSASSPPSITACAPLASRTAVGRAAAARPRRAQNDGGVIPSSCAVSSGDRGAYAHVAEGVVPAPATTGAPSAPSASRAPRGRSHSRVVVVIALARARPPRPRPRSRRVRAARPSSRSSAAASRATAASRARAPTRRAPCSPQCFFCPSLKGFARAAAGPSQLCGAEPVPTPSSVELRMAVISTLSSVELSSG